ncbi:MAG: ATP12 family protein [Pseudomonadota bacterium]
MRRTYKTVGVAAAPGGFGIRLDDKPLRTPTGTEIVAPTRALAEALAAEWAAQGPRVDVHRLALTRIAGAALDIAAADRRQAVAELLVWAETELVCHRASEPPALVARQQAVWDPLLDWLARRFGARLSVSAGVRARPQPAASLAALSAALDNSDAWRLAGIGAAAGAAGSLVVALALAEGRLDAEGAFAAAELDASFQIEAWGEDREATARRAGVLADLAAATRFLALCRSETG